MTQDPLLIFTPSGKRGRFPVGTPILAAARKLGVDLDSVCGGRGVCSKCQIAPGFGDFPKHGITSNQESLSEINAVEARYDRIRGLAEGRRLGCQATLQGDLIVDVPPESQVHRQVVRKEAQALDIALDPAVRAVDVTVPEPDMHEPLGDFERLRAALDMPDLTAPLSLLQDLQKILRSHGWQVRAVIHDDGAPRLIGLLPRQGGPLAGLAIDLGSTTIAAHLIDLQSGAVLASSGVMNPQIRFGEDLMSRVSYAMMNEGGVADMTAAVQAALDGLAAEIAQTAGIDPRHIYEAVIVCNPVMHHLLLGIDPVELGQAPFALAHSGALRLAARDLGLASIAPAARSYLLPCIAGHVGADAAAVALAEAPHRSADRVLIVDVGTNAELLLGTPERVYACSSPTGPAFEGAQISSGQRAAPGAIERVRIDPETKQPRFRVIGQTAWSDEADFIPEVTGICGSGIIEAVAEMRRAGLLDATGLIGSPEQTGSPRCISDGRTHAFLLFDASAENGPRITITQNDIRAIQLAKSALYAGARLLMEEAGVETLDRVVLAGAFGAHISPEHAMILGLIPDAPLDHVTSAGNAAGTGARMALLSRAARAEIEAQTARITKIETALAPAFQAHFVAASAIPHASDPFPHLPPLPDVSFGGSAGSGGRKRRRRAP